MRFAYAIFAMILWMIIVLNISDLTCVSADTKFLAFAIMFAGAMAGGDGK